MVRSTRCPHVAPSIVNCLEIGANATSVAFRVRLPADAGALTANVPSGPDELASMVFPFASNSETTTPGSD